MPDQKPAPPQKISEQNSTAQSQQPDGNSLPKGQAVVAYFLGWLTGIILLIASKHPYVRFHAMQSLITFGGISIIYWILESVWQGNPISVILGIIELVLWILLMVKAGKGERYKLPFVGDLAEQWTGQKKSTN